jgi:hypothetical protein
MGPIPLPRYCTFTGMYREPYIIMAMPTAGIVPKVPRTVQLAVGAVLKKINILGFAGPGLKNHVLKEHSRPASALEPRRGRRCL